MKTLTTLGALLPFMLLIGLLGGCQSETQPAGEAATRSSISPGIDTPPDESAPTPDPEPETPDTTIVFRTIDPPADYDEDGILDESDPWPYEYPAFSESPELALTISNDRGNGLSLESTLVSGDAVEVTVFAPNDGTPLWLQWRGEGRYMTQPVQPGANTLEVPELRIHQVALIAGNNITGGYPVSWFGATEPLIYPVTSKLHSGETVELYGENLNELSTLSIGSQSISWMPLGAGVISVDLPELPDSDVLSWSKAGAVQHSQRLNIVRQLIINPGPELSADGWYSFLSDGQHFLTDSTPVEIPAGIDFRIYFGHDQRDMSVVAQVWPDQSTVTVNADSTLESWFAQLLTSHGLAKADWKRNRARLPNTQDFADLTAQLNSEFNGHSNHGIARAIYEDYLQAGITWRDTPSTLKSQAIFAGTEPLFDQAVTALGESETAGKTYAGITVSRHTHIKCTKLPWEAAQLPANAWPSDLCVDNDTPTYTSAGVTDENGRRLRRHSISQYFDPDMLGPKGFGLFGISAISYLATDSGEPVCRMKRCKVDFITGGFGLTATDRLPEKFNDEYSFLVMRTLIEKVIIELMGKLFDTSSAKNDSPAMCMIEIIMKDQTSRSALSHVILDAGYKVKAAPSDSAKFDILYETVVKYMLESITSFVISELKQPSQKTTDCFKDLTAKSTAIQKAKARLSRTGAFLGKLAVPVQVADAVKTATDQWEIFTMPKYITFTVKPRAEVSAITTPYYSYLTPQQTDSTLKISGCHITNQKLLSDGTPDPDREYWPDILFTDTRGKTVRMSTKPSYRDNSEDLCASSLIIPVQDLSPVLSQLKSGTIRVELRVKLPYDTDAFAGFPSDELPLPGGSFTWKGEPKILGLEGGYLIPDAYNSILGNDLDAYKDQTLAVYLESTTSDYTQKITDIIYRNSGEIAFKTPLFIQDLTYKLSLIPVNDPASGVTLNQSLPVKPATFSTVRLLDRGPDKDDEISITLYGADDYALYIGTDEITLTYPPENGKSYAYIDFNSNSIFDENGGRPVFPVRVVVFCQDGGEDGQCTWGVDGEVKNIDGSVTYSMKKSGKTREGYDSTFEATVM